MYNQYYEKFDEFQSAVFDFFENRIHGLKDELKSLMAENFHLIDTS